MEDSDPAKKLAVAYVRVNLISLILAAFTNIFSGLLTSIAVFWVSVHFTAFLTYRLGLESLSLNEILQHLVFPASRFERDLFDQK